MEKGEPAMQDEMLQLIREIGEKPGLYIGCKSLPRLRAFLDGYCFARRASDEDCSVVCYHAFGAWLAEKYGIREPVTWDIFLPALTEDEARAFDLFYEELGVYCGALQPEQ